MTLKIDDYYDFIKDILSDHGINHVIEFSDKPNPIVFSPSPLYFKINVMAINRYLNSGTHPELTDEEILSIMVYHEIGHVLDARKHPPLELKAMRIREIGTDEEWREFILERELNAWNYGRELVPEHLLVEYDKLNENNMMIYENQEYKI